MLDCRGWLGAASRNDGYILVLIVCRCRRDVELQARCRIYNHLVVYRETIDTLAALPFERWLLLETRAWDGS